MSDRETGDQKRSQKGTTPASPAAGTPPAEPTGESGETAPAPDAETPSAEAAVETRARDAGSAAARPKLAVVGASIFVLGILFFANTWARDFWTEDELRVATVVAGAEDGDWLTPRIGATPELERPPLVYWLSELSAGLFGGDPRWTYRIPVTCFALLSLALTFGLGASLFTRRIAFAAMLIQGATFFFFVNATWLGGDLVFATFCQLGVAGLVQAVRAGGTGLRWAFLGWVGVAGAALSNGLLLAPVLVVGSVLFFLLFQGGPAAVLRGWFRMRVLLGVILFALLVSPWYVALYRGDAAELLLESLPQHLGVVAGSTREVRPVLYHLLNGLLMFLPWTLLVPLGIYHAKDRMKREGEGLCLWSILFPVVVLSLVPAKDPGDLLIVCPYVALLIAASIHEAGEHFSLWEGYLKSGGLLATRVVLVVPLGVVGATAAMLGIDSISGESWLTTVLAKTLSVFGSLPAGGESRLWSALREPGALAFPVSLLLVAAVGAFFYSFWLQRRIDAREHGRVITELAAVSLGLFLAGGFLYSHANALASGRSFSEAVQTEVGYAPVALYGERPSALYYYLRRPPRHIDPVRPASGDEKSIRRLRELAAASERAYIITSSRSYELLRRDYPSLTARLKEVKRGYLSWSLEMILLSNGQ